MERKRNKRLSLVPGDTGPGIAEMREFTDAIEYVSRWRTESDLRYHEMRRRRRLLLEGRNLQLMASDIYDSRLNLEQRMTKLEILRLAAEVEEQMNEATRNRRVDVPYSGFRKPESDRSTSSAFTDLTIPDNTPFFQPYTEEKRSALRTIGGSY